MKASWVCLLLVILLRSTHAVNLVVIRDDDSASKSVEDEEEAEEDSDETVSSESRDIDMLVDLIEKATTQAHQQRKPVRTVRVVRQRKTKESSASTRKERTKPPPKEIHVHYHTHQVPVEGEDTSLKPVHWQSLTSHLDTYKNVYKTPLSPLMALSAVERFKQFKDFEDLLQTKKRTPTETDKQAWKASEFPDHFDDAVVQHPPPSNSDEKNSNLERLKRYQALLNSRFKSPQPADDFLNHDRLKSPQTEDFKNRDRFAGFTDFSTLESSQPNPKKEEPKDTKEDDLEIRDFAIVIKTKPRMINKDTMNIKVQNQHYRNAGDVNVQKQQYRKRTPVEGKRGRPISVPQILDAPGGAPQYVERHKLIHRGDKQNLNSIESQQRQRFMLRPGQRPGIGNHIYNGWVIQRWLR